MCPCKIQLRNIYLICGNSSKPQAPLGFCALQETGHVLNSLNILLPQHFLMGILFASHSCFKIKYLCLKFFMVDISVIFLLMKMLISEIGTPKLYHKDLYFSLCAILTVEHFVHDMFTRIEVHTSVLVKFLLHYQGWKGFSFLVYIVWLWILFWITFVYKWQQLFKKCKCLLSGLQIRFMWLLLLSFCLS